jgi:SAM-dependent methyltransferase
MDAGQPVAAHYGSGELSRRFLDAAAAAGLDVAQLRHADLAVADEFHIGGRQATIDLAEQLDLVPAMRLLDVGSGAGGTSRYLAAEYGCHVTGIDLTPEYVELASELAARTGLTERVSYQVADATDLPVPTGSFDGAFLLHVGMNVAEMVRLCTEVARVLAPGAFFAIYDVMRVGEGQLSYPQPWAGEDAMSFVQTPERYRSCLDAAGFVVNSVRDRREFALAFFRAMRERIAASGLPPLGLQLLMGADFSTKINNMADGVARAVIAPVQMIARLPKRSRAAKHHAGHGELDQPVNDGRVRAQGGCDHVGAGCSEPVMEQSRGE